jgi:hypothetical protein
MAIRADRRLTDPQRHALLGVYRSYVESNNVEATNHKKTRPKEA